MISLKSNEIIKYIKYIKYICSNVAVERQRLSNWGKMQDSIMLFTRNSLYVQTQVD